jgi:hypothetical protein
MVQNKLLLKGLENDKLYFVEGKKYEGDTITATFNVTE